ncbi:MAG: hypothetical protein ABSG01_09785 [Anaerolineales bacterium]|jgi:hypothetical protein
MDHRPFEDWLLDNQPLTINQKRQLNDHLQDCSSCTALAEVNLALKSVRMVEPASGFVDRFEVRLAAKKKALRIRNIWGFVILSLSAGGIFTWVFWPVFQDLVQSPVNLLGTWIASLVSFWASFQAIFRAGMVLFKVVPGFVPSYIWAVILFGAGAWSFVWVASLIKFTKYPQGV